MIPSRSNSGTKVFCRVVYEYIFFMPFTYMAELSQLRSGYVKKMFLSISLLISKHNLIVKMRFPVCSIVKWQYYYNLYVFFCFVFFLQLLILRKWHFLNHKALKEKKSPQKSKIKNCDTSFVLFH